MNVCLEFLANDPKLSASLYVTCSINMVTVIMISGAFRLVGNNYDEDIDIE